FRIGRSDFVIVVNLPGAAWCTSKNRALQRRSQHLRQQQIWNRAQLIARRWMSRDIHAQPAQLLNQPPNFRAASSHFLRNLSAADHNGSVAHEQPDNAPQANIGSFMYRRQAASFCGSCDAGIINSCVAVVSRWQSNPRTRRSPNDQRRTTNGRFSTPEPLSYSYPLPSRNALAHRRK